MLDVRVLGMSEQRVRVKGCFFLEVYKQHWYYHGNIGKLFFVVVLKRTETGIYLLCLFFDTKRRGGAVEYILTRG